MNIDKLVNERIDALIEMHDNLNTEVNKAGGAGFTLKQLKDMSALDLLLVLSPNHLKIKYEPPTNYDLDF